MKRYGSMEKSVIYVSILAFVGVVVLIVCLGMAAASDNSIVANVNVETEKIGITLNTKDGLVLDTSLNNVAILNRDVVNGMLSKRRLNILNDRRVINTEITTINIIRPDIISVNLPRATSISDHAFYSCYSLTSVNFPNAITIGASAFFNCYSLTSVNFPNVKSISAGAFYSCGSLTSVNLPNATSIGASAFQNCLNLTSVKFPPTVTLTGLTGITINPVFSGCYRLGEGISTLTVNAGSSHVVDDNTGISQGRTHATHNNNGVITFG